MYNCVCRGGAALLSLTETKNNLKPQKRGSPASFLLRRSSEPALHPSRLLIGMSSTCWVHWGSPLLTRPPQPYPLGSWLQGDESTLYFRLCFSIWLHHRPPGWHRAGQREKAARLLQVSEWDSLSLSFAKQQEGGPACRWHPTLSLWLIPALLHPPKG